MKFNNRKIMILAILAACLLSIAFVGVASADGITLSPVSKTITKGESVTFTFAYDANYTYAATATDQDSNPFTLSTPSPSSDSFTQIFDTAGTYTIKLTGTKTDSPSISGESVITVNAPASKTNIETVSISLNSPVKGGDAPTSVTASGDGVASSATISWTPAISGGKFSAGTQYNATITFSAAENYQFTSATTVSNKGTTIASPVIDSSGKLKATISFEATESETQMASVTSFAANKSSGTNPLAVKFTYTLANISSTDPAIALINAKTQAVLKISPSRTEVTHTFATGTHVVRLKVVDGSKIVYSNNVTITVTDPVAKTNINSVSANVTAPATGNKPATTATLGASTYELDSITWYKDGTTTALDPSKDTFASATKYKVTIVLKPKTNYIFNSSIAKANAKINGNEPSSFNRDSDTKITMSYTFPATTKLAGPGITLTITPKEPKLSSGGNPVTVTYTYKITGNPTSSTLYYGDGSSIDLGKSTEGTKTHAFTRLGSYSAYIISSNENASNVKSSVVDFNVEQYVLIAKFDASKTSGTAPLKVTFTDKSSGDITSYIWDFGDKSVGSSEKSPSHTYEKAGTYTVTLTISDGIDTTTATQKITVSASSDATKTDEKKESSETNEAFITIGNVKIPSPIDIIADFVHLIQSMFDYENFHVFSSSDDKKK